MSTRRARADRPPADAVTGGPDEPADPAVGRAPGGAVADLAGWNDQALELARSAAADEAGDPDLVGPPVDTVAEDGPIVTVRFASLLPGYRGWLWSVTMALLDGGQPTVSEVVLLPGPDALIAPAWVPWSQRIRSGDLRVGDVLLTAADDPRLVPAYLLSDDPAVERVAHELGIGRVRVLSREGRADAAQRWHEGGFGPDDEMAKHAPGHCATCAFFLPLAGSLGGAFGVCGNAFSPADGHVVDVAYGCGAHSEATDGARSRSAASEAVVDELRLEVHRRESVVGTAGVAVTGDGRSVTEDDGVVTGDDLPLAGDDGVVTEDDRVVTEDDRVVTGVDLPVAGDDGVVAGVDLPVAGDRDAARDAADEPSGSFAVESPGAPPTAEGCPDDSTPAGAPTGAPADGSAGSPGGEIAPE